MRRCPRPRKEASGLNQGRFELSRNTTLLSEAMYGAQGLLWIYTWECRYQIIQIVCAHLNRLCDPIVYLLRKRRR